jgi:hypothetical protein
MQKLLPGFELQSLSTSLPRILIIEVTLRFYLEELLLDMSHSGIKLLFCWFRFYSMSSVSLCQDQAERVTTIRSALYSVGSHPNVKLITELVLRMFVISPRRYRTTKKTSFLCCCSIVA